MNPARSYEQARHSSVFLASGIMRESNAHGNLDDFFEIESTPKLTLRDILSKLKSSDDSSFLQAAL